MKSTVTFKQFFYESMTAGTALGGSPNGFSPDSISGSDFYNTGSAVIPQGGAVFTRAGKLKRGKNKKRKSRKNKSKK